VIPVHNGAAVLGETLAAVQRCQPAPREVIVVDDGSTDGTAWIAAASGSRLVSLEGPVGPATARTRGAQAASAEVVVFADADVLLPADVFALLDDDFASTNAAAVQGTFSEMCPFPNYCSRYKNLYNRSVINALPDWIDTTFTSLTAVRRDFFFSCGGFDCNIATPSVEDRTLGRNLVRAGGRILLDRRIEVVHKKRLTLPDLLRNQFRRSRDLAKLLLRNRGESRSTREAPPSFDRRGRFGTNAPSTMARIPVAYLGALAFVMACLGVDVAWALGMLCAVLFLGLVFPFTWYLAKRKGWGFAVLGMPLNLLDAFVSGAGIAWGLFDFVVRKRRY